MDDLALRSARVLALCAGAGGLELAVRLAWPESRLVGAVEREAFAAAVLVARMEDSSLEAAPIWDDLATFDGRPWRGAVDLVTAGFPCQPVSSAGQRLGDADVRWLWPDVARVVREVEPSLVFVENVPDLVTWGGGRLFRRVLGDLADLGFDAQWSLLSARALGATQLRKRVYLLAYRNDRRLSIGRGQFLSDERHAPCRHHAYGPSGANVADAHSPRASEEPGSDRPRRTAGPAAQGTDQPGNSRQPLEVADSGRRVERPRSAHDQGWSVEPPDAGRAVASAPGSGRPCAAVGGDGSSETEGETPELGRCRVDRLFPPGPDDLDEWRRSPGPQPAVRRVADGLAHRLDRIHAIGNGVVPLVAAYAFLSLARRAGLFDEEEPMSKCELCWTEFDNDEELAKHVAMEEEVDWLADVDLDDDVYDSTYAETM